MNFKDRIKDLKKYASKISLLKMNVKEFIGLSVVSLIGFLSLSLSILMVTSTLTEKSLGTAFFSFILSLAYGWMIKDIVNDIKDKRYIVSQKVILQFIESFPTEYHEQVKYYIADKMGQKKSFSLFDLRILEKKLTIETLKNMKESETQFKESYNNIILEKQKEHVMH